MDLDSNIGSPTQPQSSADSTTGSDHKRQVHLRCEQQRRESIKTGYERLKELLPPDLSIIGYKMTNAAILYRTSEYLKRLHQEGEAEEQELTKLKSQLLALQIICQNYEHLLTNQNLANNNAASTSQSLHELKLKTFETLIDHWFESFAKDVDCENYIVLAHSLLSWIERSACPEELKAIASGQLNLR